MPARLEQYLRTKKLFEISVSKQIPAEAAYAANDVIASSTSVGTPWTFDTPAIVAGGTGYISKAQVIANSTGVTPELTLFLFNTTPSTTANLLDNIANNSPLKSESTTYIGRLDFAAMDDLGTTLNASDVVATPSLSGGVPFAFNTSAADNTIYGVLVTRDAVTLGANSTMTVKLTIDRVV